MRCEDALFYWQQDLLGQPVDQEKLKEAYAHIGTCQELCARVLGASPDDDLLATPEQQSGQTDLYEALGSSAEEEGDAHAREWTRLKRQTRASKGSQEALDLERAMALAAWQSAANYYHDGLRVGKTVFLTEGLKRIRHKRLEPTASGRFTKTDPRSRASRVPGRSTPGQQKGLAPPGERTHRKLPHEAWPRLALVSHGSTHPITVSQRPAGWHIHTLPGNMQLLIREHPAPYPSPTPDTQADQDSAPGGQPAVDGPLEPFEVALWASEFAHKWDLELLVRAESARHPWTSIMLTMEDEHRRFSKPTLMEFTRRAPEMSGWWARLKEVSAQAYQLHLSANDSRGQAAEGATLDLHLVTEE
ncbi:MAG TPA: hypothetical protein VKT82_26395 [Ktedonobacterales bacterium]|nr:hypothetical protein [Ktedonobacterales bacterium]